jgi:hypothetical protein
LILIGIEESGMAGESRDEDEAGRPVDRELVNSLMKIQQNREKQ